ncbi:MAG: phosphate regulon transcriptional regulator PhoB [Immundisolibacteraceae bacterium]|nr:phosphate regulon transcriptional regulator PhoB [Immundisolibacteraceae bacterium]
MTAYLLIVDDEPAIRDMLVFTLENAGYNTAVAASAASADRAIAEKLPDLMLLDWMMPGENGKQFSQRLRGQPATRDLPIIMLTARSADHDLVAGLDAGADDYISKPFSNAELLSRIKALLRRTSTQPTSENFVVGELRLDPLSHRVTVADNDLTMGPTEYNLLQFFLSHRERVYSRSELIDHVWGQNTYIEERTVDVHIRRLREVLSPHGYDKLVQTVRGAGYRFSTRK